MGGGIIWMCMWVYIYLIDHSPNEAFQGQHQQIETFVNKCSVFQKSQLAGGGPVGHIQGRAKELNLGQLWKKSSDH